MCHPYAERYNLCTCIMRFLRHHPPCIIVETTGNKSIEYENYSKLVDNIEALIYIYNWESCAFNTISWAIFYGLKSKADSLTQIAIE